MLLHARPTAESSVRTVAGAGGRGHWTACPVCVCVFSVIGCLCSVRQTGPVSSLHPSPREDAHRTVHMKRTGGSEQHPRWKGLYEGLWLAEGQ